MSRLLKTPVYILGIESSCDETAAAVVEDGRRICSNVISSQVKLHAAYGGVVPEIASRRHLEQINLIIEQALAEARLKLGDLSAVAVSNGPGLVGALLVGVSTAKALAYAARLPLIAVNHVEAHLYANFLTGAGIRYPLVALIASGGHTNLLLMTGPDEILSLGQTRDDAAGEAFDKVARAMGLGYPGGPIIDRMAAQGNPAAFDFPRAYLDEEEGRFDFSFSGLKSAVINHLHHLRQKGEAPKPADLAASFQEAVVRVLVDKTINAAREHNAACVLLAGGVAANSRLRFLMREELMRALPGVPLYFPPPELCTDNAAMVAAAAYPLYRRGIFAPLNLNAHAGLPAAHRLLNGQG
ncbi:MAG: tRNA (adenosine(37)-N6)-threonylcarbamoyltransferase complex transferase subunit TsaD [Firmicutes bacterium]|nr:tRNA (adenosine(37)-N6)-threonylcarbamoyltransferase complex transferase subunit TsaD [Bacillota bacterium]HPU02031.1 tRNA (adenosine(37)-N6)-threonylcarbamoyltransferase complex transferase subunit TsaD [Bacillota bacterium]